MINCEDLKVIREVRIKKRTVKFCVKLHKAVERELKKTGKYSICYFNWCQFGNADTIFHFCPSAEEFNLGIIHIGKVFKEAGFSVLVGNDLLIIKL